jgi:HYR domain
MFRELMKRSQRLLRGRVVMVGATGALAALALPAVAAAAPSVSGVAQCRGVPPQVSVSAIGNGFTPGESLGVRYSIPGGATIRSLGPFFAETATDPNPGAVTIPASGFIAGPRLTVTVESLATGAGASRTFSCPPDTTPPTISCPNVAVDSSPSGTTAVTYPATASDPDDPLAVTLTFDRPSGSTFEIGTTSVAGTATDADGNTSTCSFNVTVRPTFQAVCSLTQQDVESSPRFASLPNDVRSFIDGRVSSLCAALGTVTATLTPRQQARVVAAYKFGVGLLTAQGFLTSTQASALDADAQGLVATIPAGPV